MQALTKGTVQGRFGHHPSYYAARGRGDAARHKQIFANMFEVYSDPGKQAEWAFFEEHFPLQSRLFLSVMSAIK